jgi:acetyltransferase-like isoleucine patch superfamily enzyme
MEPIISKNCRIRYPELFSVGNYSIVDDYCYFSTKVQIGKCCHVGNGCSVSGGKDMAFTLGDYSGLGTGAKILCRSDNFLTDMVNIMPPELKQSKNYIEGDVKMDKFTAIGSNCVLMPSNHIPEGTVITPLSFVPSNFKFKPWSVYGGTPIRLLIARNKESVMKQFEELKKNLK